MPKANRTAYGIQTGFLTFKAPDPEQPVTVRPYAGREYSATIANKVCERLMQQQSLNKICKDPSMPSKSAVIRWLADPKLSEFREMYYYARRVAAEMFVDEIFEIADDGSNDWKPRHNANGELLDYVPDNEAIQRSRVRIDARKWYASKMVPRIYGDKLDVDLDATGDLAELLKKASNRDKGLPPPIEGETDK